MLLKHMYHGHCTPKGGSLEKDTMLRMKEGRKEEGEEMAGGCTQCRKTRKLNSVPRTLCAETV